MLSKRVEALSYSAIRKLMPLAQQVKKAGKEVIHLNIGVPDSPTPEAFYQAIGAFAPKRLAYAPAVGLEDLRLAMSQYFGRAYGMDFGPDEIVVTAGASEALMMALYALTDPGDEVLTTNPFYSNYQSFIHQLDLQLKTFDTDLENAFALPDRSVIEAAIGDWTRVLLVCNPSNPTGKVLSREEVELLLEIAEDKDLVIVADEIYRDFVYDGGDFVSFADYPDYADRVVVLDSVSKRFSACGARLGGIMVKNKALLAQLQKLATARLAISTVDQVGGVDLYQDHDEYLAEVLQEYQVRRDLAYEALVRIEGVKTSKPAGAFYFMVELPVEDSEDFAKWLLTDFEDGGQTIMLAPAGGFYTDGVGGGKQVRLSFAVSQEDLLRGLDLLRLALAQYNE